MPGKVILNATGGELAGTKYRFDSSMVCFIGRADNCSIQLDGTAGEGVSRRHCLLDIRPPKASIQDLGSRNGTYLNDINIGFEGDVSADIQLPTHELHDGDSIQIGNNVFRVNLIPPKKCYVCHTVLSDSALPEPLNGHLICNECLSAGLTHPVTAAAKTLRVRTCSVCGIRVTLPPDAEDPINFVCGDCLIRNADPHSTFRIPEHNEISSSLFTLPGYKILKRIGRGGMGEVFLGQSLDTLEKVAIKILRPEIAYYDSCREDFLREAENLKPLKHPNIVGFRDCGVNGDSIYLIQEYCSGGTLRSYIRQRSSVLELPLALDLTFQILDALDYAHHVRLVQTSFLDDSKMVVNGLVHRDIKPENIFLSSHDGIMDAKLSDFGLAKAFDMAGLSGCTATGDFSGTLGFISKQQFINTTVR